MLAAPPLSFGLQHSSLDLTGLGTSVTAGASSNTKGSWVELVAAASVTQDVYLLRLRAYDGFNNGQFRNTLVDIGIDPAGGTSYSAYLTDLPMHQASSVVTGCGLGLELPIFIPKGASIAVRTACSTGAATTRFFIEIAGAPAHPGTKRAGQYSETIGLSGSQSAGAAVTPGVSAAFGSWTLIGTTTKDCWWWQLGFGINDTTQIQCGYIIELAWGDGTNFHTIIHRSQWICPGTAESIWHVPDSFAYAEVPAGSSLYARLLCTAGTANQAGSEHITVVGVGG